MLRLPEDNEEFPFFAMSILLLRAALFEPGQDGSDLLLLADWVVAEEKRMRTALDTFSCSEEWLLGLTFHNLLHTVWKRQTQVILEDRAKSFPEPAATKMLEMAKRLSG